MRRFPELIAVFLMVALASCGGAMDGITGGGGGGGGGVGGGGGGGGTSNSVTVADNSYTPSSITVPKRTTVTWKWAAGATLHSVTFDDGATSSRIASGSFSRTFDDAGTFPYHCNVHGLSMSGSVTVQ